MLTTQRRHARRQLMAVLAGSTLVTLLVPSAPAAADPVPRDQGSDKGVARSDGPRAIGATADVVALMKNQVVVDRVADRISSAAPDTEAGGFAGVVVDPAHHALTVYWHGPLPAAVSREVTNAREGGVGVTVASAPYTRTQLLREAERLVAAQLAVSAPGRVRVVTAAPRPDGSGVTVGASGPLSGSATVPGLTSSVALTVEPAAAPVPATRQADTPPYYGGAFIRQANGSCTSGFGVTGNNGAATYILTAAHCGQGTWSTGANVVIGSTIPGVDFAHDGELILTSAGSAVYDGASIAGGDQFYKWVAGASTSHTGDFVCTSGAQSGAICNIRIANTGESFPFNGHQVNGMVRAEQQNHTDAAGNGDSGGPTFSLTAGAVSDIARGTISAYDGNQIVPCAGVPSGFGRQCSWRIWYPDIMLAMNGLGVHINA
jgi:hypothetical protein